MKLMKIYKDNSVNPIIINVTLNSFEEIWKHYRSQKGGFNKKVHRNLLNLWKYVPYQFLSEFLTEFNLLKPYQQMKIEEYISYYLDSSVIYPNSFLRIKLNKDVNTIACLSKAKKLPKRTRAYFKSFNMNIFCLELLKKTIFSVSLSLI